MRHEDFQDARFPGMEPQPIEHEDDFPFSPMPLVILVLAALVAALIFSMGS